MSRSYLMALDAGGGGGHCLLVETETRKLVRAFRPWSHPIAPGTSGLGSNLDLEAIWGCLAAAAGEALARSGAAATDVVGIAATSTRHTTVVLDKAGEVLFTASNRDGRAAGESFQIAAELGPEIYSRTGHWPSPLCTAARIKWLAAVDAQRWKAAATVFTLGDWLTYRLCGLIATDPSQAGESLLLDVHTRAWADDLADRLGVPKRVLPQLMASGSRAGALSPAAAQALGLAAGTPVAIGGGDTQCGLLGAGAVSPGQVAVIAGTTVPVQMVLGRPVIDAQQRLWTGCHVVPGTWVLESNAGPMGEAAQWFARSLHPDAASPVAQLFAEAALSRPGASGVLASLGVTVMNARELRLPVETITLTHLASSSDPNPRRHLARAVVEGMACGLRANLDQLHEVAGNGASSLSLAGGMSRSDVFAQIVSDILALPVEIGATGEATALGAAICAGAGAGAFRDLADGAARLAANARTLRPNADRSARYAELYDGWQQLRRARVEADSVASQILVSAYLESVASAESATSAPSIRPRILVTADMDEGSLDALRKLGDVEYGSFRKMMRLLSGQTLVEALRGVQVFITEIDVVDPEVLRGARDLRVVASCRGEAVNVDLPACTAFGVPVLNAPGRNADAVADLALAFMLMLARKLPAASAFLHQPGIEAGDIGRMGQAFTTLQGRELWQKTVGLVGLGAVGRGVAKRLAGFGARVVVFDPFISAEQAALAGAERVSLEELLERSDFVSLHAPVTDETAGMMGAEQMARMKPGSFLINTARAALVDEDALIDALRSGHLGGAGVDVFPQEPPGSDHPLLAMENVVATPHVGGNTADVAVHQGRIIAADLRRLLVGERPLHALNPEVLAAFDWQKPRPDVSDEELKELSERPPPAVSDLQRDRAARPKPAAKATAAAPGTDAAPPPSPAPSAALAEIKPKMEKILRGFVDRLAHDTALRAFAAGKDVALHFTLSDLELSFYLRLHDGGLESGLGEPEKADVELKMRADVLDGMFTGRVNPMEAATSGRLSFAGDTVKAMTLQQVQGDMSRLYREAREEAGDPGDLAAIGGGAPAKAAGHAPQAVAPGDIREQVIQVVKELYATQLITATGGNVSARSTDNENEIWITPSQFFKGDLRPEILVRIDIEGHPLDSDAMSPSSERLMHCEVYRVRKDAHAVIHAHAPNATILANAGLPFLPISTEAAFFGEIPRVPFIMPGTEELAKAVGEAMKDSWAVLMQNHGLLVAGRSLRRAADMVEIIERSAEVILGCYALGKPPPTLPENVVRMLQELGDLMA